MVLRSYILMSLGPRLPVEKDFKSRLIVYSKSCWERMLGPPRGRVSPISAGNRPRVGDTHERKIPREVKMQKTLWKLPDHQASLTQVTE